MSLTPDEEVTLRTYNKLAKEWANGHIAPDYWRNELDKFHALLPKGRVLEVGCGSGRDAKELLKLGYDYVGTDISDGLITEARLANPGATFQQVSLYDLNFDEPFDGFWCAAVLLHIPKKRIHEALKSIRKNIRPGGIGFIAIKEGTDERVETRKPYDGDGRFFAYWKDDEFKKVLIKNRFKVIAEEYLPMSEHTTWLTYQLKAV